MKASSLFLFAIFLGLVWLLVWFLNWKSPFADWYVGIVMCNTFLTITWASAVIDWFKSKKK